tara:strand:- start:1052 stop:2365 length:1314 start_codon:yes stop_codon:yes gene_type:complete
MVLTGEAKRIANQRAYARQKLLKQQKQMLGQLKNAFLQNELVRLGSGSADAFERVREDHELYEAFNLVVVFEKGNLGVQLREPRAEGAPDPTEAAQYVVPKDVIATESMQDNDKQTAKSIKRWGKYYPVAHTNYERIALEKFKGRMNSTMEQYFYVFRRLVRYYVGQRASEQDIIESLMSGNFMQSLREQYDNERTVNTYTTAVNFFVNDCNAFDHTAAELFGDDADARNEWRKFKLSLDADLKTVNTDVKVWQIEKAMYDESDAYSDIFADALERVDSASQTAVLLHLTRDLPLRNDYDDVFVYQSKPANESENHYVRDEGVIYWRHINKTGGRYNLQNAPEGWKYSDETRQVIERSLTREPRNKLITKPSADLLRAVGTSGTKIRQASVTELYADEDLTEEQKREKATQMQHSFSTQKVYVRNLRKRFVQRHERF